MLTPPNAALLAKRYEIGVCIGRGGMGAVYRGIDRVTGELVAIKRVVSEGGAPDPTRLERFRREGEALTRLNHPNIVRMIELVHENDADYIVMELVTGGALSALLASQESPLPLDRVLEIALDLCDALARCHRLGVIHRDLKPSNILLAEDGTPRLTDFGVAQVQGEAHLTQTESPVGTTEYLSPEALRGDDVDARADIWAFGVVLFEMLTLKRPFGAGNVAQTLHRITFSAPPDLEALRPDCPPALVDLIYGMLAKDRTQRVASIRQVSAVLDGILQLRSGFTSPPPRSEPSPSVRERALSAGPGASAEDARGQARSPHLRLFPTNLPAATSTFVGRLAEISELQALIESPQARLVTLLGPGGMGKTRLALELGQRLVRAAARERPGARPAWLADGVFWIPLAPLESAELVLSAIAEGARVQLGTGQKFAQQVFAHFRNRRLLLILDNFEHLVDGAGILSELLSAAEGLRVLVTSRERLGLQVETLFPLSGMDFPDADRLGAAVDFSAIRLFTQCARQQRPDFKLDAETAVDAARICRLVEGIPLGIVLSASWAGTLSPREIAQEIDRGLDFLSTEWRDVPERQRSMRTVFEHSWLLLEDEQREVLSALSVFVGGFGRDAAQAVAKANFRSLAALMDKSLLARSGDSGRFEAHELLRQFAANKLSEAPARRAESLERHAQFYARYLESRLTSLKGPTPAMALEEIETDLDNVRAAFRHLLDGRRTLEVAGTIEALNLFHTRRASFGEAETTFAALSASLKASEWQPTADAKRLLGYALALQAMFLRAQGHYPAAMALLAEARRTLTPALHPREYAFAQVTQGSAMAMTGELEAGTREVEQGVLLYRGTADTWGLANALEALGRLHSNAGDLTRAAQDYLESAELQRGAGLLESASMGLGIALVQQGQSAAGCELMQDALVTFENASDRWNAMRCRMHLANTWRTLGEYRTAETLARECLDFCEEVGNRDHEVWAHFQLGNIMKEQQRYAEAAAHFVAAHERSLQAGEVGKIALAKLEFADLALTHGDFDEARQYLEESSSGFERAGQTWGLALALDLRGYLACKEGQFDTADELFRRAYGIALSLSLYPFVSNIVAGLALVRARTGDPERAVELLTVVRQHVATERHTLTRRVTPLRDELAAALGKERFSAAEERGKAHRLETLYAHTLRETQ